MKKAIDFFRSIDRRKAFETWRTTFAILGSAGYAGMLSTMNPVMVILSGAVMLGTCCAVYRMLEL
jgi:hypothetical protein